VASAAVARPDRGEDDAGAGAEDADVGPQAHQVAGAQRGERRQVAGDAAQRRLGLPAADLDGAAALGDRCEAVDRGGRSRGS
jgi:hypothetical protein